MHPGVYRGTRRGGPLGSSDTTRGRGRGGGRGRGWGARGGSWERRISQPSLKPAQAPLGALVAEIKLRDLEDVEVPAAKAKISNLNYVASYSLVDSNTPKILVPGQPAAWNPQVLPAQLSSDRGEFLRDQNGARFPDYPILPSVQAIFAMNQTFDPATVDVVGCASSLGDILRFAGSVDTTFRFDVEMVGNTLFMIQNAKKETIPNVYGYGHSFLDTFTSYGPEVSKTKSHQRLVSYDFGNLKCLVRFECDGFDAALESDADASRSKPVVVKNMDLEESIHIDTVGRVVSQQSILEVKTRSLNRGPLELSEHLPRLWVRQIPILVTGYHKSGLFEDVQKIDVTDRVLVWEEESKQQVLDFARALRQLIVEIKRTSHPRLEVYRSGTGPLQLREQIGGSRQALPDEWESKWAGHPSLDLHQSGVEDPSDDSDSDDDEYPTRLYKNYAEYDDYEDHTAALDYTACDLECEYCGRCEY